MRARLRVRERPQDVDRFGYRSERIAPVGIAT
jgi:hypothetical protein